MAFVFSACGAESFLVVVVVVVVVVLRHRN
jgi:heme exporter protein D